MKRKQSYVRKSYYVNPQKKRRSSFSSELSHQGGGSGVRNARTDGGWNYSRQIVSGVAALGTTFATGNAAAGSLAYSGTSALFGSSSNIMPGVGGATAGHVPFAPTTEFVGKHIKGRKNVKFSRKANVKVSKKLRKKIEKVMVQKMVTGHVKQIYTGAMGALEGTPLVSDQITIGGIASLEGLPAAANSQYIWQTLVNFNTGSAVPVYQLGIDFRLFSPYRILDCASILWNDKTPIQDYNGQTGNFSSYVTTVGVPTTSTKSGGGPQIMVKSAKATFLIKNNSQRTQYLRMYVCKAKRKAVDSSPLDSWVGGMFNEAQDATNTFNDQLITYGPTATDSGNRPDYGPTLIGATPNISKGFQNNYKYECVEMCLEPGQIVTQVVHGPKHQEYDWSTFYEGGASLYTNVFPKFDRWVFFVGNLDLVNDSTGRVGHQFGTTAEAADYRILCVEMTLDTVLAMPEHTGFKGNSGTVGPNTNQPLNMRRPRKALLNFTNYLNTAYLGVARVDDENPVTTSTG